jgi:hypothetical protein
MVSKKLWSFLLAVTVGVIAVAMLIGLADISPAFALARAAIEPMYLDPLAQPPPSIDDFRFAAFFTDDSTVQFTDLSGNVVGEGVHGGEVKCKPKSCSHQTYLSSGIPPAELTVYEYKFATKQALDPEARRAVVAGTGTISSQGQKERFTFTATFEDNKDGSTVGVRYEASRPDASFIIPEAPGAFLIFSKR